MATIKLVPPVPNGAPPKVSVIITAYNHQPYLAQCLESVLSQVTTFPFEIIVGEDCSTDGTRELLQTFFDRHPGLIRMVLPDKNLGPNRMYVEVMRAALGKYFALLDGDDYWISTDKLERQTRFLDANVDYQVCFHDATVVDEDGRIPPRPGMPELGRDTFGLEEILMGNFIPTVSVMHRRVEVDDLPPRFIDFQWSDWLILILCAQRGSLRYLHGLQCGHRIHRAGLWSSMGRESQIEEEIRIYEHLEHRLPGHRDALQGGLRRCKVQLAVERVGLPYDLPVAVLQDSSVLPCYLNGRTVWPLPARPDRTTADVLHALSRMRRVTDYAPSAPHWPTESPTCGAHRRSLYCVVEGPAEWVKRLPEVWAYLEDFTRLFTDEWCAIYELPTEEVQERRIAAVRLEAPLPSQLRGRHIDSPEPGALTSGATLELIGWALGLTASVVDVRVNHGTQVLARTSLGITRPDLAAAFPDDVAAGTAGFHTTVDVGKLPPAVQLIVCGDLQGGESVVLAQIETTPNSG